MSVQGHYVPPAEYGDRVRFTRIFGDPGEGVYYLCWLGVTEVWNVRTDDDKVVYLYPELGDTMERV